jgi:hypothetical protein
MICWMRLSKINGAARATEAVKAKTMALKSIEQLDAGK